jgi:ATP-dependent RNA helicase DDX60
METTDGDSVAALHAWNASLSPQKVEILGDFAGKELFAIHGESLIAHCVAEARVDFAGMKITPLLLLVLCSGP